MGWYSRYSVTFVDDQRVRKSWIRYRNVALLTHNKEAGDRGREAETAMLTQEEAVEIGGEKRRAKRIGG